MDGAGAEREEPGGRSGGNWRVEIVLWRILYIYELWVRDRQVVQLSWQGASDRRPLHKYISSFLSYYGGRLTHSEFRASLESQKPNNRKKSYGDKRSPDLCIYVQ
jgi:hypothetical protein